LFTCTYAPWIPGRSSWKLGASVLPNDLPATAVSVLIISLQKHCRSHNSPAAVGSMHSCTVLISQEPASLDTTCICNAETLQQQRRNNKGGGSLMSSRDRAICAAAGNIPAETHHSSCKKGQRLDSRDRLLKFAAFELERFIPPPPRPSIIKLLETLNASSESWQLELCTHEHVHTCMFLPGLRAHTKSWCHLLQTAMRAQSPFSAQSTRYIFCKLLPVNACVVCLGVSGKFC